MPGRLRGVHGPMLLGQLQTLHAVAVDRADEYDEAELESGVGLQIEFETFADAELLASRLADERRHIELSNVRVRADGSVRATVWVPQGALVVFENKVRDYMAEKRSNAGKALDFRTLIDAIQNVRVATFDALWTDDDSVLPADDGQVVWWEVWLSNSRRRRGLLEDFRSVARGVNLELGGPELVFPERIVILVKGSRTQLQQPLLLSLIAEIRRARDTAEFFDGLALPEQAEWVENLEGRLELPDEDAPSVCLLDTGVNRGHPLLAQSLDAHRLHTVDPAWGVHDDEGHGTELAGLALYGDLQHALTHALPVALSHSLESVKLLRTDHGNEGENFGVLTIDAVAQPEVREPDQRRAFCLAISSADGRDRGRPSAWSATIDRLASDWINDGQTPRLFCLSAGNIGVTDAWLAYPGGFSQPEYGIEEPGQAWNALTVGAYTEKCRIDEADAQHYQPIAPPGALSPFSSTSVSWDNGWPWKPDVVFEGGNAAQDGLFASTFPSLSLLTTHHAPADRLLTVSWATSAATALAANMAAQIMAAYPGLWPETIRALIVHSARRTPQMLRAYSVGGTPTEQHTSLLRHCGYGVPDVERALWSASNSLTLLVQDTLQPFMRERGDIKTRDMHIHDLPWPQDMLADLGAAHVRMRVTLSYFIEPNPGERGFNNKYSYQSHGLRFDVRRRAETDGEFESRINKLARDSDYAGADSDPGWELGDKLRRRGSLHSDVWEGTAADLANRGKIAVFPTKGWWKTRRGLQRFDHRARYALTVSIEAPEVEQDIYAAVQAQIPVPVVIKV